MKVMYAGIATIIFFLSLGIIHYIHMAYFKVNVVFYASIGDAAIAASLAGAALFFLVYFKSLGSLEKLQLVIIWLLAGYAFAISIPTVIDRSLSFYILEKLQQRGGGIWQEKMQDVFVAEYLVEHRLIDVRLTEQLASGTIVIKDGCVKLTPKGEKVASFGRFYRQHLLPKKRLLMGEYTADLTDPFRQSNNNMSYMCQ